MIQRLPQRTIDSIRPMSGNGVAARGHPNSVGALENRGSVPHLDNGPAGDGCRPRFPARRHRRLRRHRHCGWTRIGLGGEDRARAATPAQRRRAWECCRQWRVLRFAIGRGCRLSIAFRSCRGLASAMAGEGASFCAIWSTPSSGLRPRANAAPPAHPSAKLAASAMVASRSGARAFAIWLTQHQHVIAIAAQEIRQARRLSRQTTRFVIKDNRLAVLHGVTHGFG